MNCNTKGNILHNGRKTIAVMIGDLSSIYQEQIMRGIHDAAQEKGFNIVAFSGGAINSTNLLDECRYKIFEIIDTSKFDGIILPMSSHGRYLDKQQTYDYMKKISSIPLVNIGGYMEGYTNIISDFEVGLSNLFEHLVNVHGYRRIAFFRGPRNHQSSEERMRIYMKLLKKHDISFDENLIIYGNLTKVSGEDSVKELLDVRGESCEAIICVNDNQALGAMDSLKKRGINIPQDIAVTGTLGSKSGMFCDPPLTTIKESIYDLGRTALFTLADKLEGKKQPSKILIPTELIIRNSCGCETEIVKKHYECTMDLSDFQSEKYDFETYDFNEIKKQCIDIFIKHRCSSGYKSIENLIAKYNYAMTYGEYMPFVIDLRKQLEKVLKTADIIPWLSIVSVFEYRLLRTLNIISNPKVFMPFLEDLISLKDEFQYNSSIFQSYKTDFYIYYLRLIISNINSTFDLKLVTNYTVEILDLSELYISLYEKKNKISDKSINMIAIRNKKIVNLEEEERRFTTRDLIPQCIEPYKERYTFIIFPLSYKDNQLGFFTVNLSKEEGKLYKNIQAIISTALKIEHKIQELQEAEERFSDIAHSTYDWLWETNEKNKFTYCSNNVFKFLGYTEQEMIGKSIFEFSMLENIIYDKYMESKEDLIGIECWKQHKNRSMVCLLISGKPIFKNSIFIGYRGVFKDITQAKLQEENIKKLAYYDILTGLPNRTMFSDKLEITMKLAEKEKTQFAVMFLDMDRFKYVNDSMGHAVGDTLLKKVTELLKICTPVEGSLARLGGDEFTVIIPNIKQKEEAIEVAKKMLNTLIAPIIINGKQIFVTISIGIAIYPVDGENSISILKNADTAMYRAKDKGRNQYVFYDKHIEKNNQKRIKFEELLYNAIENGEFIVEYQPQIDSYTKKINGVEALVRIYNKDHGIVAPDNFIPLAEELGVIQHVDGWVFEKICKQYNILIEKGRRKIRIAVNISPLLLKNEELVDKYMKNIRKYNVNPSDIILEITENALIENEDIALKILNEFKKHGINIALDDFGTGHSSLHCINIYPIDIIKIDRMFVKDALYNPKNIAIINGIVSMANSLNMKVIAEGVETIEEYNLMKRLGCNEIQGYYFSKPCSELEIENMFNKDFHW
jgi:diguanylate cyclase (GGDEF)-like protein/PAS domain S-box-containing protein